MALSGEVRSYYRQLGEGHYASTELTGGAWSPGEQHMAVATGLLVHELEAMPGGEGRRLARISLDIHGMIHTGECEIVTRVVRPGRRIELVEAEWRAGGRQIIVARAWRLATEDTTEVMGLEDARMAGPETVEPSGLMDVWGGAFVHSLEYRALPGARRGRAQVWLRSTVEEFIEGVPDTPLARLLGMVDVANGVAPRLLPGGAHSSTEPADEDAEVWSFPNVDLQLHLFRAPRGEWLGLDTQQQYGPDGVGLTSSVLHDLDGPFGHAEQILLVRRGGH